MRDFLVIAIPLTLLWEFDRRRMRGDIGTMAKRVTALHVEVAAWQTCHDHTVAELDRRMSGLEATTAMAANEIRMASTELMSHLPDKAAGDEGAD